ncbi:hypothetical protein JKG47_06165 [Acidithiobacillus sp. MC6.1]|nr:hypothetical protein [Acidithiobacillus sp. MC6.1]
METSKLTARGLYFSGSILVAGLLFVVVMGARALHLPHFPEWFGWIALGVFVNFIIAFLISFVWQMFSKKLEREIGDATKAYYVRAVRITKAAVFRPSRIQKAHHHTFPRALIQVGSIGLNVGGRNHGRQAGRKRRGGHAVKKTNSDDPGGEGGDPPRPILSPLFLSFFDLATRWSCAGKTLRNQVSCGKLPRPVQLPVGPRFPIAVIQQIESGEWHSVTPEAKSDQTSPTIKKRGRPRIAGHGKGGAA